MKHLILVIAILSGMAQAQQPANCLELKKVKITDHLLHQLGDTRAELTFKARNCRLLDIPEKPALTFESQPELTVTVNKVQLRDLDEESAGTGIAKAKEMLIEVKLSAWNMPVGEHQLRGIVTYQTVNNSGAITPESLAISLPFKVAPPKPPHQPNEFVEGLKTTGEILTAIVLSPVILVAMLIYCPISGNCPDC